jgi:hypothetical protein
MQDRRIIKGKVCPVRFSLYSVTSDLIKREGITALWSGFRVQLFRMIPATCTSFLTYEYISSFLSSNLSFSSSI